MAKLTAKELIEKHMPNLEVISSSGEDSPVADSAGRSKLSAAELRRKFLEDDTADDDQAVAADGDSDSDDSVDVVQARKKSNTDGPLDEPLGKRTFIVSKGRILGSQG